MSLTRRLRIWAAHNYEDKSELRTKLAYRLAEICKIDGHYDRYAEDVDKEFELLSGQRVYEREKTIKHRKGLASYLAYVREEERKMSYNRWERVQDIVNKQDYRTQRDFDEHMLDCINSRGLGCNWTRYDTSLTKYRIRLIREIASVGFYDKKTARWVYFNYARLESRNLSNRMILKEYDNDTGGMVIIGNFSKL